MFKKKVTIAGTDIEEVKRQNAQAESGKFKSKNVKEETASEIFSQEFGGANLGKTQAGTNIQKVKEEIAEESSVFSQGQSSPSVGKTVTGTNIQKVKEEIAEESSVFSQGQSSPSAGKTVAGTDIQKVKKEIAEES